MSTVTDEQVCPECDEWVEYCECGNVVECYDCGEYYEAAKMHGKVCPDCHKTRFSCMVRSEPWMVTDWAAWTEYAEHVKSVDFGCHFDCDGKCACSRDDRDMADWGGKKACCVGCASNKGYLDCIPAEALELVESLYDDEDGFWRPGGCTLPHEYRSHTCLNYTCYSDERKGNADNTGLTGLKIHLGILQCTRHIAQSEQRLQLKESKREERALQDTQKRLAMLLEEQAELEPVEQE